MQVLRRPNSQENVSINLAATLGRGGEACIYTVATDPDLVAKVYHKPTVEQAHKLEVMIAHPPENPTANLGHISIAWPIELLRSAEGSDRVVGFLMPRIQGMRPSIDFYNPRTRRQNCPLFNYQYLVRAARNLAAAFASLHASGYCVGDVNESNILVSDTALVTVVDTDSFQVRDPNSNFVYRCPVGKPEFTPPELQNKTFAECERTVTHDLFGLAVLIFQFLMEGTHPFSGIFQGYGDPPAYEARIAQGHFTYSQKRRIPYIPTPISPPWEILHPSLQDLFVRSFEDGYNNPELRPTAQTWLSALTETENSLVSCSVNSQHRYSNHLHKCPWCERTLQLGGRDPFLSIEAVAAREHLQLQPKQKRARTQTARDRVPRGRGATRTPQVPSVFSNPRHKLVIPSQNISYYKPPKKPKFYPFIFCLLGFGLLGYLDLLIKFTSRPFIAQNSYAQQVLANNQDNDKNLTFADYYQQGHASYKVRDYEQAVERFTKAIQKDPKYAKAYINRGNAHYNLKEYEAALADYNQAIRLNPNEVKAYENRGNVRFLLAEYSSDPDKDYNLAIADFNSALRLNSNDVEAYVRRGVVRSQIAKYSGDSQQEYRKAIQDFNSALSINPNRAEAFFQRGIVRYQIAQYSSEFEREYKQAIEDFNRALHLNSQMAKAYLKRGIVRYELAQYGGNASKHHYSKAVEDLQTSAKISLAQNDMENYQQALSSICVVLENKCDNFFQNASISSKGN
ncbi:tetratricopeptide repeat protein [Aetokthonos hydrillicola Thurmond2011]|jgi:DNA-binding helix-hairpin-helix protein with protein kinase domain|uniref:Tetratricopeptide repeat protein n=1 Tax=Aetokthonos hydrillicola Thurmond2011 TaxID=2712845 RepID=A0AAP5ICR9_9CYAN|nr:tetratricopeptide repeat protein [Aetokthonos hydrillicola]MBO3463147.1 tetratricopeptide repeat protein [Aetokthonos hydrillicola CCALA 1050]MBW4589659.1 tetratricopeptide repeat protein [Aetokthonos hydrillicola CCALA 1050]MDR9899156.1 tetratricopeptide repeat protein [Aetokthonos hydrillicola Thurmond2011]